MHKRTRSSLLSEEKRLSSLFPADLPPIASLPLDRAVDFDGPHGPAFRCPYCLCVLVDWVGGAYSSNSIVFEHAAEGYHQMDGGVVSSPSALSGPVFRSMGVTDLEERERRGQRLWPFERDFLERWREDEQRPLVLHSGSTDDEERDPYVPLPWADPGAPGGAGMPLSSVLDLCLSEEDVHA